MSEQVNFFRSGQVAQQGNTTVGWSWGVGQSDHFVGFSFFPDSEQSILTINSTGYEKDANGNCIFHFTTTTGPNLALFSVSVGSVPP